LSLRARAKVQLASRASNPKAIKMLTGADKKLQALIQKTNGAFQIDRITEVLMHLVTDRARTAREIVQGVKAGLTGLNPPGTGGH
jgi:chromosomal replication initiation ATPase DnaA